MIAVSDALECSSDFQRNKTGRKKAVGVAKGIETETETQTQSMKRLPWVSGPVSLSSSSSLVCASRWTEDQGQTTKIRDRGNKKWQTWPWVGSLSMYIHIYIYVYLYPSLCLALMQIRMQQPLFGAPFHLGLNAYLSSRLLRSNLNKVNSSTHQGAQYKLGYS